jgi:lysophospholipase I
VSVVPQGYLDARVTLRNTSQHPLARLDSLLELSLTPYTSIGVGQQFQMYSKLPHLRWVLPNAPFNREAMSRAWYLPKALLNAAKPRVPGHESEDDVPAEVEPEDDEAGIMWAVGYVDSLVEEEVKRGVDAKRIVVGGFSQGCAVSTVWGLTGRWRDRVGGVVCLSGYFPLAGEIERLRMEKEGGGEESGPRKKWFLAHGTKDMMISARLFQESTEKLSKIVDIEKDVEGHLYEGMVHSTSAPELRDLLGWLDKVVPA